MAARFMGCVLLAMWLLATSFVHAEEPPTHSLRGTVVDENDKPVPGALLVLSLRRGWDAHHWAVEGTTNDGGQFELVVPAEWLALGTFPHDRTLWVHAPGYAVGNTSIYKQLDRGEVAPLEVKLLAEQPIPFHVQDPEGAPLAGCRVQPHHWHTGHIPPKAILERIASTTNETGVATIHGITPALVRRMEVVSKSYGTQHFAIPEGKLTSDSPFVMPMLELGTLEGTLECDDKSVVANVRVAVETQYRQQGVAEGFGLTTTDDQGRFKIANIAEGVYGLYIEVPEGANVRPVFPTELAIKPHETTTLHIPYAPTAIVRGKVVARGSDKPVSGAYVSIRHGSWRQGEDVLTDENGNYEARVLPGPVRWQLIRIPRDFESWVRWETPDDAVEVSLESSPHELPPLELNKSRFIEGTVLDIKNAPLANASISGRMSGRYQGYGRSDEEGKFRLQIAEGVSITSYGISLETTQVLPAEVVTENPLVLRLQDLNKLANITETKSPTPEDKRQPPKSSQQEGSLLIVAKNVLIFEGRAMDWADLTDELDKRAASKGGDIASIIFYTSRGTYEDSARTDEATYWTRMLSDTMGLTIYHQGMIFNEAAERYDSLQIGDPWPPGAEKPVRGRVVDAKGKPVVDAQVVLFIPAPASSRFGYHQSISLGNYGIQNAEEHIVKRTDKDGRFQFDFPAASANVLALAPEGYALVGASSENPDIQLAPWSRVTAEVEQKKGIGFQTVSLAIQMKPENGVPVYFDLWLGSPGNHSKALERLAVPSGVEVSSERRLWNEDENGIMHGKKYGYPYKFTTEPGMTHHLELGPVEE